MDYKTILKLDEEFKNGLVVINPFIFLLRSQNYVQLCRLWIDKLIHCAPKERQLRNLYLEQLCRHAEQQVLRPPFNNPPHEGPLPIIPVPLIIKQGVILAKPSTETENASCGNVSDEEGADTTTSCYSISTWNPEQEMTNKVLFNSIKRPLEKSKELIVMYNSRSNTSVQEKKILELESKLENLTKENGSLQQQLSEEKQKVIDSNKQLDSLKNEVEGIRHKFMLVETIKDTLQEEHKNTVNSFSKTVSELLRRVESASTKNDQLEQLIMKMTNEMKRKETEDTVKIKNMQTEWNNKQNALEEEYNEKMKSTLNQTVNKYENLINELKTQLHRKNKDLSRLEKQLDYKINEAENIKNDLETSLKQDIDDLKAKINFYTNKIVKLVKCNKKVTLSYEQKINSMKMEFWLQKLNASESNYEIKQEMETTVSVLEEKFRNSLNELNQISLNRNNFKIRQSEITQLDHSKMKLCATGE